MVNGGGEAFVLAHRTGIATKALRVGLVETNHRAQLGKGAAGRRLRRPWQAKPLPGLVERQRQMTDISAAVERRWRQAQAFAAARTVG